jgi:LacI family transcriptional regulator
VLRTTGIGRRALEKRFKRTIHRTIYNEIQQVRIELISKLPIETDLPISQITSLFNFTDVEHVSRYFKKGKGISIREFRNLYRLR